MKPYAHAGSLLVAGSLFFASAAHAQFDHLKCYKITDSARAFVATSHDVDLVSDEALFPDDTMPIGARIVPYDPTNRVEPGLRYIAVAVGRDYADVATTSGSFVGRARGELHYTKRAQPIEVEYLERNASAVPTGLRPPHPRPEPESARHWARGALA